MENLKISGVSRRTLKISFMQRLKKSGDPRRTFSVSFMGRLTRRGVSLRTLKNLFARLTPPQAAGRALAMHLYGNMSFGGSCTTESQKSSMAFTIFMN